MLSKLGPTNCTKMTNTQQTAETILNNISQVGSLTKLIQTGLVVTLSHRQKAESPKQSQTRHF